MPSNANYYHHRARAYLQAGEAAKGLDDAARSLQIRPDDPVFRGTRGRMLEALGRRDEAVADYRASLSKNSNLEQSREGLKRLGEQP